MIVMRTDHNGARPGCYPPIIPHHPHILHGGDYNPEQWRHVPGIWDEDFRLMDLAACDTMSLGIFAWSALEPREGVFDFSWLDDIMERLAKGSKFAVLATPSGARPAWMAAAYPEVLRVGPNHQRNLYGTRHNHCYTSPVYREKCVRINTLLAERYAAHPALALWHVSNEYGGECHCPLCQEAFRAWLKNRYLDIDTLNAAWWSDFWSHRYNDWSQIESPSPQGETTVHALNIDWKRFVTYQTIDFFKAEAEPLRRLAPSIPVTVNMMGTYPGLDYWKFAAEVDVVSWDCYPSWGTDLQKPWELAADTGFVHDLNRSLKGGKPFMLMESTPSLVNWQPVNQLKAPGLHALSSLQAVAHGADTIQYFQWRKSRGSYEKFHGAVVDHDGTEHTRVFSEVAALGQLIGKLDPLVGATTRPRVAIVFDWENHWAINDIAGLVLERKRYEQTVKEHYRAFWKLGIETDIIAMDGDFTPYSLVVAPMLYMIKPNVQERLEAFVVAGGTLVATYLTGYVDQYDLCFLGGMPGGGNSPLRRTLGVWAEEIDSLYPSQRNSLVPANGCGLPKNRYEVMDYCELLHVESAEALAHFGDNWYLGRPALTRNHRGKGCAWHIAARTGNDFLDDFHAMLAKELRLDSALGTGLPPPEGLSVRSRSNGQSTFLFLLNFGSAPIELRLAGGPFRDLLSGTCCGDCVTVPEGCFLVLVRPDGEAA